MSENGTLTQKQGAFVRALLTSHTTKAAAAAVGVSSSTAYRWLQRPAVREALQLAEGEAIAEVGRGLLSLAGEAAAGLRSIIGTATPAVQVRCWEVVLTKALQIRELAEFEQRLVVLEEFMKGVNDANTANAAQTT